MPDLIDLTDDRHFAYQGKIYHRPDYMPDGKKLIITMEEVEPPQDEEPMVEYHEGGEQE